MNFDFEAEIHRILEENDEDTLESILKKSGAVEDYDHTFS